MVMTRRNFLEAGLGGAALTMAQRSSHSQSLTTAGYTAGRGYDTAPDLSTVVIGVDGSSTAVGGPEGAMATAYIDLYLSNGATVWQYSDNIIDQDDFAMLENFVAANSSKIILAKSYNDILAAKRAGKVAMVVGIQECTQLEPEWFSNPDNHTDPHKQNNWDMKPPTTQLCNYYEMGLRLANLAYNLPNFFGGGCLDDRTPLSSTGEFLVQQMQEMGILVDCSHSSEQTTLDIINMATRPVVCSHSNVNALNDNPRNISDRVIKGIADTGGLIGVNALSCFLTWSRKDAPFADTGPFPPQASISKYVDVMDYIKHLVGIDHVGIGGDFTNPHPQIAPPPSQSFLYPPEMTYNQPDGIIYVTNFHGPDGLPFLYTELKRRGYSSIDIAKIFGGNWMRVFREAWNA